MGHIGTRGNIEGILGILSLADRLPTEYRSQVDCTKELGNRKA